MGQPSRQGIALFSLPLEFGEAQGSLFAQDSRMPSKMDERDRGVLLTLAQKVARRGHVER